MEGKDKAHLDSAVDTGGRSLLLMAAMAGHTAVIEALLAVGERYVISGVLGGVSIRTHFTLSHASAFHAKPCRGWAQAPTRTSRG